MRSDRLSILSDRLKMAERSDRIATLESEIMAIEQLYLECTKGPHSEKLVRAECEFQTGLAKDIGSCVLKNATAHLDAPPS